MGNKIKFHGEWKPRTGLMQQVYEMVRRDDVPICSYDCGTITGLYAKTESGMDIIMIMNDCPHNGDFGLFLLALEKLGRTCRVNICSFYNERLYNHIKSRPGWDATFGMNMLRYLPKD